MADTASSFTIAAGITLGALLRQTVAARAGTIGVVDPIDARVLIMHGLQLTRVQLITQDERLIDAAEAQRLTDLFQRRLAGEPVAYIVGMREFHGLAFEVTPDVLIPRPDTELLVELALERAAPGAHLLDLGTGSGAIAVALAHARPDATVTAVDLSPAALDVARRNAARHGAAVRFLQGDWYAVLGGQHFHLIVANPPYIVAGDAHLSQGDLRFEPLGALTDHADGLSALRTIAAGAPHHLEAGGWLLMEHGYDQAQAVRELLQAHGFGAVQSWRDLAGIERVTGGVRPA